MKLKFLRCLFQLFFLLCLMAANSGASVLYKTINSENSNLPSNIIYRIFCDKYGYVWLATENGIVRYNGSQFDHIKLPGNDQEVANVYTEDTYTHFFTTIGKMYTFNNKSYAFESTDSVNKWLSKKYDNQFISVAAKIGDTLFLSINRADDSKTQRINGKYYRAYNRALFWNSITNHFTAPTDSPNSSEVATNGFVRVYGLKFLNNAILYENRIYKIVNNKIELFYDGATFGISGTIISYVENGDDLYVAYHLNSGIVKFENYKKRASGALKIQRFFEGEKIMHLTEDTQNNLWISLFRKGVAVLPIKFASADLLANNSNGNSGIEANYVNYIGKDSLIVGYPDGSSEVRYGNKTIPISLRFKNIDYAFKYIIPGNKYWAFFFPTGVTIIPQWQVFNQKNTLEPSDAHFTPIKDIYPYQGKYIISSRSAYSIYNNQEAKIVFNESLPNTYSSVVLPSGKMIFATLDGLFLEKKIVPKSKGFKYSLLRYYNNLLFACNANSIQVFDTNLVLLRTLTQADGLTAGPFSEIHLSDHKIFVLGSAGISIIDANTLKISSTFSCRDFIVPFRINSFFIGQDNEIVLASSLGVLRSSVPAFFYQTPPKIFISSVNDDKIFVPIAPQITETYNKLSNINFRVDVLAINSFVPKISYTLFKNKNKYFEQTELNGSFITLGNLAPGLYELVLHIDHYNDRKTQIYKINILPQWYQTTLFMAVAVTVSVLTLFSLFYWIYRKRIESLKKGYQLKTRIAELQSKALFAQMKPHFIFNALNPLQSFILKNKKEEALDYLDRFAILTRTLLNQSRDTLTTIKNEITFLQHYVYIAQTRFSNNFVFDIDIAEDVDVETKIHSMLVQPLVENAIEHGIKNLQEGHIKVIFKANSNRLSIVIADNGVGLDDVNSIIKPNHAITIIKERIELIKRETGIGAFIVKSTKDKGCSILLILPVKTNKNE